MALWLYTASSNFAGASTTYDLAYRHGIVWRSYYANRTPPQAIPNVGTMAPGDTLYLGYREKGRIALIGRMRLGRPDPPHGISPVFTAVPATLVSDFSEHGYSDDPVMRRMMGLFVEEVEPVTGTIPSQGRLTITQLLRDPLEGDAPFVTRGELFSESSRPVDAPRTSPQSPSTNSEKLVAALEDVSFVGVDVAGRSSKGYDVCKLVWSKGIPVLADFKRLPHATPLPPTSSCLTARMPLWRHFPRFRTPVRTSMRAWAGRRLVLSDGGPVCQMLTWSKVLSPFRDDQRPIT